MYLLHLQGCLKVSWHTKWLTMNPHLKGCDSFARGSSVFCLVSHGLFLLLQSSCVAVIVLIWEMKMLVPIRGMVSSLLGISGYELVQSKGAFIFHQNKIWKRTFLSLKKKREHSVLARWSSGPQHPSTVWHVVTVPGRGGSGAKQI